MWTKAVLLIVSYDGTLPVKILFLWVINRPLTSKGSARLGNVGVVSLQMAEAEWMTA